MKHTIFTLRKRSQLNIYAPQTDNVQKDYQHVENNFNDQFESKFKVILKTC